MAHRVNVKQVPYSILCLREVALSSPGPNQTLTVNYFLSRTSNQTPLFCLLSFRRSLQTEASLSKLPCDRQSLQALPCKAPQQSSGSWLSESPRSYSWERSRCLVPVATIHFRGNVRCEDREWMVDFTT